jgi:two-component system, NarL family, nitrate/nitrite response regulator NarL
MARRCARQILVVVGGVEPLFLDGLARSVRQDPEMRLVGDVDDASKALVAIRRHAPDVAVLDERLDALRILRSLAQQELSTRVVLLATDVRHAAFEAVAAGAQGYLSKQVEGDAVRDAIRRAAAGESVLCREAQTIVTSEIRVRHQTEPRLLTPREQEILVLLARGLTYADIGRRLHLAPSTVKSHANRVYERFGVHDRASAVAEGFRRGILE